MKNVKESPEEMSDRLLAKAAADAREATGKTIADEIAQLRADNQNLQQTCMALQTTVRVLTKMVP